MSHRHEIDTETLLDQAVGQIAESQPEAEVAEAAAARVWNQLNGATAAVAAGAAEVEHISGCEDYQALIPAFLADALPAARKVLVEEHTRSCVPCRRALKEAREGKPLTTQAQAAPSSRTRGEAETSARKGRSIQFSRWALAATLILGIGMAQFLIREFRPFSSGHEATVETIAGDLFRVSEASHVPIREGDVVREGEIIRTGRDGGAVLRLEDGSLVELRQRSEVSVDETRRGTVVELERGSVIVQAADQRQRHLFVSTEDCLVSVTGTVFSVDHGTKGSRVSVIEGEVRVSYSGDEQVLRPGDQVATQSNLDPVSLEDQYAWGRDLDTYLGLMEEISDLKREIREAVPRPGQRYNTTLLDLMPEGTVLYVAVPNLGETVRETHRLVHERIAQNPELAAWWQKNGSDRFRDTVTDVVEGFGEFSDYLGEELAVGAGFGSNELQGPLMLAEVEDEAGLRDFIERKLGELEFHDAKVVLLDDLTNAPTEEGFYMWLSDGMMVGSPNPNMISQVAAHLEGAHNPFTESDFHDSVAQLYGEGAEILLAADLESVVSTMTAKAEENSEEAVRGLRTMGVHNARHMLAEQKNLDGLTHHRIAVTFSEAREGFASWLAAPAPMGVLDFISSDAKLVAAFVVQDPVKLFDELRALEGGEGSSEIMRLFQERHGIDLRDDFVSTLGGEFAIAIDGPLLPKPSWKVVFEVYDPARFQWSLEQALAELNTHLAEEGEDPLAILHEEVGGRSFYSLEVKEGIEVHYTYVEGYLLAAPSRALLDRSIRFRDSGVSITDHSRFTSLLPADGRNNFSLVVYQDLSDVMQSMADTLAKGEGMNEAQQRTLNQVKAEASPTLGYAYADDTRITFASAHQGDLLSSVLMQMFGVNNPADLSTLLKAAFEGMVEG